MPPTFILKIDKTYTTNEWIKTILLRKLYQAKTPTRTKISIEEKLIVKGEICYIVVTGDVKLNSKFQGNLVSKNFLKWKKDGNFQPIIILKTQNKFIFYHLFKMKELN